MLIKVLMPEGKKIPQGSQGAESDERGCGHIEGK